MVQNAPRAWLITVSNPKSRLWIFLIAALAIIYFINCFTPLRLTIDTVRYFAIKENLEGKQPDLFGSVHDFLPYGYVLFLAALSKLGMLSTFTIAFLQLLYLAGSLFFVTRIFSATAKAAPLILFTLLNWMTLKFTITPLSEMQFLFFSAGALYFFQQYEINKRLISLFWLVIFCGAAVFTRTIGIVLPAALLITLLLNKRKFLVQWIAAKKIVAGITLSVFSLLVIFFFTLPGVQTYLSHFAAPLLENPVYFFSHNIYKHTLEWGEMFINIPFSKIQLLLPGNGIKIFYVITGLLFLVLVIKRLLQRRFETPLSVKIYLVFYSVLLFNWPLFEVRLWFPVLPFFIGILFHQGKSSKPVIKQILTLYKLLYIAAGIAAMCYYTWLCFTREEFARRHDAGIWQREYEQYFFGKKTTGEAVDEKALYILNHYD